MEQRPEFFFQLWVDRLFILFTKTVRPRNQLVVPKINQELNEPSYEMVDVKITVNNYGQYNRIFFLVDFLFSFLTTPNVFIVMVLKCTY
jgi:F0F1-type ATP synthase membrane subunit a